MYACDALLTDVCVKVVLCRCCEVVGMSQGEALNRLIAHVKSDIHGSNAKKFTSELKTYKSKSNYLTHHSAAVCSW